MAYEIRMHPLINFSHVCISNVVCTYGSYILEISHYKDDTVVITLRPRWSQGQV